MSSQRRVNEAYDQRTLAPTNLCSIDTQRSRRLLNNIEISEEHKKLLEKNQLEISILSPSGRKFRSKPQLAHYQGDSVDLTAYDYQSGKVNSLLLRKNKNQRDTQFEYSRGVRNDASLVPPIRQTASIFKQPVTVYKTQEGKVKTDFKHGPQEKPKQLFWEKRLEGLRACDIDGEEFNPMELPKGLKTVGPHVGEETTYQSIATALHVSSQPVTGQTGSKTSLEKNPGVFLNPEQPLIQAVTIADEDIRRQEERVQLVRRKLQEALKA